MNGKLIRLNKYLALYAGLSRRKADRAIEDGLVLVNGHKAILGEKITIGRDEIKISEKGRGSQLISSNEQIQEGDRELVYYAVNKPRGVVSTTYDDQGRRTVLSLLPNLKQRVYPIGRLDVDSEGLLFLTNDGALTYKMTHPKKGVPKIYEVSVRGLVTHATIQRLRRGVKLKDGITKPCEVEVLSRNDDKTILKMVLTEGRNRQIRRMLKHFNFEVAKLVRVQIGQFHLSSLGENRWLELDKGVRDLLQN